MPRSFTAPVARLTVDRPQMGWDVGITVPVWLNCVASQIEAQDPADQTSARSFAFRRHYFGPHDANARNKHVVNLTIPAYGALSPETRKRIANWVRSRAKHIASPRAVFEGRWFTQEFSL